MLLGGLYKAMDGHCDLSQIEFDSSFYFQRLKVDGSLYVVWEVEVPSYPIIAILVVQRHPIMSLEILFGYPTVSQICRSSSFSNLFISIQILSDAYVTSEHYHLEINIFCVTHILATILSSTICALWQIFAIQIFHCVPCFPLQSNQFISY